MHKSIKKMSLIIVFVLIMIFILSSCQASSNSNTNTTSSSTHVSKLETTTIPPEEEAALKENAEIDKFNAYITISNSINGRLTSSLDRYEEYFGLEDEMMTDNPHGLYSISEYDVKNFENALEFADKEPKILDLDNSVKKLVPKILDMITLINQMESYYDLKNYVDDNFEKGKLYHSQLIKMLDDSSSDFDEFFINLDDFQVKMQDKDKQKLKDEGKIIQYYTLDIADAGKELYDFLYNNNYDSSNVQQCDIDKFKPYYDNLTEAVGNFMDKVSDASAVSNESQFANHRWFSMLETSVEDVKKSATTMFQLIKDNKEVNIVGSGSPEELSEKLNSLISNYNRIIGDLN